MNKILAHKLMVNGQSFYCRMNIPILLYKQSINGSSYFHFNGQPTLDTLLVLA